jgi:hypothetical protein
MTPEALWRRYAAIWSLPESARMPELESCVADDVSYCDPNSAIQGRDALSGYMGGFQVSVPSGRFEIVSVLNHHGRMLAHWTLMGAGGTALQSGASFALATEDGRLHSISGFFPLASV